MQWNDGYTENIFCFANNINTHDGGTHLSGFKGALTRTLNAYAQSANLLKDVGEIQGDDTREGLTRRGQRQGPEPAVRGPDQGQARQLRGQGHRREPGQRDARRLSRGAPDRRASASSRRSSTPRGPARRRARPAISPAARARSTARACPASWRSARSGTPSSASSISSRATRPAAPPSRAATASSRPSCPCGARS